MQKSLFFFLFLLLCAPAVAQDRPSFHLPVDCTPGKDCWVLNYVDMDPAEDVFKDPQCGPRGYDAHKGTDIAIRSKAEMDKGVRVLAAMDGTVEKIRDGEPDRFPTDEEIKASEDARKECGNAVLIDHGNALKTIYCHLKKDSILVEPGQEVKMGDPIAKVGLSGVTEFPHLHFGILWEGAVMDPFTGASNTQGCGSIRQSLWHPDVTLEYHETDIYNAGFSTKIPDLDAIDRGDQPVQTINPDETVLTFWFAAFGIQAGDKIDMAITDPNGKALVTHAIDQPKTRARVFYYIGKNLEDNPLDAGTYKGTVTIKRQMEDGSIQTWAQERDLSVR